MSTFLTNIKQFELLLQKINLNKIKEISGDNDCENDNNETTKHLADQVQFKTNWELLVVYLSSCFVCGFKDTNSKDEFQQEFMNLILKWKNMKIDEKRYKINDRKQNENKLENCKDIADSKNKVDSGINKETDLNSNLDKQQNNLNIKETKKDNKNDKQINLKNVVNNKIVEEYKNGQFEYENSDIEGNKDIEKNKVDHLNKEETNTKFNMIKKNKIKNVNKIEKNDKIFIDKGNKNENKENLHIKTDIKEIEKDVHQKNEENNLKNDTNLEQSKQKNELNLESKDANQLKNKQQITKNNPIDELMKNSQSILEQLINLVYKTAGIQQQIEKQIELIKFDLHDKIQTKRKIKFINLKSITHSNQIDESNSVKELISKDVHSSADANQLTYQHFELNKSNLIKINKSLEVKMKDKSKGRGIFNKTELKSNLIDNLVVEKSFINWINTEKYRTHCLVCLKKLDDIHLECKKCRTINYCSKECLNLDQQHKMECDYLNILNKFGLFHMVLKVLMKEFESIDNLETVINLEENKIESKLSKNNQINLIKSLTNLKDDKLIDNIKNNKFINISNDKLNQLFEENFKNLTNFYLLDKSIDSNSFTVLICICLASIFVSKFLHLIYDFVNLNNSELQLSIKLFEIALIIRQNTMETYDNQNSLPIGHALYLTSSLFNHACRPNCIRYFNGNQIRIVQKSTLIKADNELTISYGLQPNLTFTERRKQLKERFGFDCVCIDCCKEEEEESISNKISIDTFFKDNSKGDLKNNDYSSKDNYDTDNSNDNYDTNSKDNFINSKNSNSDHHINIDCKENCKKIIE